MSEKVEEIAAINKAAKDQDVDHLKVVAKKFGEEIKSMSHWNQGSRLTSRLKEAVQPKKLERKAETSRPEDVQRGGGNERLRTRKSNQD